MLKPVCGAARSPRAGREAEGTSPILVTRSRWGVLGSAVALSVAVGCGWREPVWAAEPVLTPVSHPAPGRALAEKYCTACHLLPEPSGLTKTAWIHHVQPEMAKWLGLEAVDYEGMVDGRLIEAAQLFPGQPIIPEADWFAIWDYYRSAAPSQWPALSAEGKKVAAADLGQFKARALNPLSGAPMISLVRIDPSRRRWYAADAYGGQLMTLDASGMVVNRERFGSPPVGLFQSARRTYVTLIGHIFPSDAEDGAVLSWPDRAEGPATRPVLESLRRPTDFVAIDLNQDGREDFAVCQYGNRLGRFSWYENRGEGRYEEHVLLDRPGALAVRALDLNRDARPDLVVLMAQAREGLSLFENLGQGQFRERTLLEKPPYWGFAGFDLVDFDRDGHVDLLVANGDNGDLALPTKPYHGVRLYRNDGANQFGEAYFYPMAGAYKALGRDFDGDGDVDVAAIAFYPDFAAATPEGFVYLENLGGLRFKPRTFPEANQGRWLTMDAGDLDGDGDDDLVLGSFVKGPTTVPVPTAMRDRWRTNGAALMLLENQHRAPR